MKQKLFFFILVLICLLGLVSCADTTVNLDDFEELLIENSEQETDEKPFAELIYMVIPNNASGDFVARVEDLAKQIYEKTSISTVVKYDSQPMSYGSGILEILIGNTSRTVSQEIFKPFRDGDYICRYERDVILLGGKSESATLTAIDRFEKEILPGVTRTTFMSAHAHFEERGEYSVDALLLNGFGIYDYTVVCGESDDEREIAKVLQQYISQRSGYTLDVRTYDSVDSSVAKTIRIYLDETCKSNEAIIERVGNNVEICAGTSYGLSASAFELARVLLPENINGEYDAHVNGKRIVEYRNDTFRMAIVCAEYKDEATSDFILGLSETVASFDGELACFFPVANELIENMEESCADNYSFSLIAGSSAAVICKEELYDSMIDSYKDGALHIDLVSEDLNAWSLYCVDGGYADLGNAMSDLSVAVLNEPAPQNSGLIKIGEIERFEGRSYVYVREKTDATATSSYNTYNDENAYVSFCGIALTTKYHRGFRELKNALE
ncbi:MAG: hypothetical protein J6L85_03685 [Clostridia bacterium]|nr:hypothetical protein [Clostridia bacterium]